jgi:WD40 repeat protein
MADNATRPIQSSLRILATVEPATEEDVQVRMFGHERPLSGVTMPLDGRFAITSDDEGSLRLWKLGADDAQPETIGNIGNPGPLRTAAVVVTADGRSAAVGDWDGCIHLVDLLAARELRKWQGHKLVPGKLAFLAEGRELLSASQDGFLRRWDARTGRCLAQCELPFPFSRSLYGVAASADGRRIVGAAWDEGLVVWSGRDGSELLILRENVAGIAPVSLPADGRFAFTGTRNGRVVQWDLSKGRRVAAYDGHSWDVFAVAVSPDGRFCVSGGFDRSVRVWEVETGDCLAILRGHTNSVVGIAITPDARRIASVSDDRTLRVWDIPEAILDCADRAARKANGAITATSKEGVMAGEVQAIVFNADQIYRTLGEPDEGVDGEIEFRNEHKKASGVTYRVQLKSGDSHLRRLKNGTEKFVMKAHYEDLWAGKGTVPVLLIIRASDCSIRYMNATEAIRAAQKANPGQPVRQIVFTGQDFTVEAVLRLRDERLKS